MRRFILILALICPFILMAEVSIDQLLSDSWSRVDQGRVAIFTKKDSGKVPVLCFHKIGSESRYELTAKNFEEFLIYLNEHNFYPLSDKEMITKDFSRVPTGFTPIVLGSDDASEGNFEYITEDGSRAEGVVDLEIDSPEMYPDTMVYLLEKYLKPANGRINFTFYVSLDGVPFRQTGGANPTGDYYRGLPIVKYKLNYLLDHFIVGIHTVTHPITRDTTAEKFKWEMDEFFSVMESYVGKRVKLIDTLAYPYGCAALNPELRSMLVSYNNNGSIVTGGLDFDGYFSMSPFSNRFDVMEISRLGVDNKNITNVYGFLERVPLFNTTRVFVVEDRADLNGFNINSKDIVIEGSI